MIKGIIIKGIGGFYYVKADDGKIYECKARGLFRKKHITPTVGDYVNIELIKDDKANVVDILPRKNVLIRPSVANIDLIVIVVAAASPDPSLFLLDKMLVNAELNNITPLICINKTDLANYDNIVGIYSKTGYDVITISATTSGDFAELERYIKGKTVAFSGLSGVGKSTILSSITKGEMESGELSEKLLRGKNTTRHVELLEQNSGGYALDTPGFSSLEIAEITDPDTYDDLQYCFPEFKTKIGSCRFRGCAHINEPDCAIKQAVEEGIISKSRYESYKTIYEELKSIKKY